MDRNLAVVIIALVMMVTISVSMIAMAVARVMTGRSKRGLPEEDAAKIEERLGRIEQAIDAMATEVERVSEGQRFATRLLADRETHST